IKCEYDFFHDTCPQAEQIVSSMVRYLYKKHSKIVPALFRLVFHDCFIQGCDASVLLASVDGIRSEKDTPPSDTLQGFNVIDMIKSKIEEGYPATVSCADILVLAARERIAMAGGPYYPLYTRRRDSLMSFLEVAAFELPSPHDDLYKTFTSFASRGFDERETFSILGAHSIGIIHCQFFHNRLYNFAGSGGPDPSLEPGFLNQMRSRCNNSGDLPEEPGMNMDYEGAKGSGFGTHYYKSLVEGKGILHADQQLMASDETARWVQTYSSDGPLFQRDFAQVMITSPLGQVRLNCSMVSSEKSVHYLYEKQSEIASALLLSVFNDRFIQGCDASVLLASVDGIRSEKDTPPNDTLQGFNVIDMIKSKIEEVCPATVSCADILVLAAREGIAMAGGPYYPLYTGRRDSLMSFPEVAVYELPSPHDDLYMTLTSFASRGFDEREIVSILGAHSIGIIHCQFHNCLYNFAGSGGPDPSLEPGSLNQMRSRCNNSGDLPEELDMNMDYEGATGSGFGTHYYKSLVEGKGILHTDQQLMASDETARWVQTYSADGPLFQQDFAQVMIKLSSLRVVTSPLGQIRLNCSMVSSEGL
ncbi:hypothetical protein IFM89_029768, partial [Coptis chinensis]